MLYYQFLKIFPKYKEHYLQTLLSIIKIGQEKWGKYGKDFALVNLGQSRNAEQPKGLILVTLD